MRSTSNRPCRLLPSAPPSHAHHLHPLLPLTCRASPAWSAWLCTRVSACSDCTPAPASAPSPAHRPTHPAPPHSTGPAGAACQEGRASPQDGETTPVRCTPGSREGDQGSQPWRLTPSVLTLLQSPQLGSGGSESGGQVAWMVGHGCGLVLLQFVLPLTDACVLVCSWRAGNVPPLFYCSQAVVAPWTKPCFYLLCVLCRWRPAPLSPVWRAPDARVGQARPVAAATHRWAAPSYLRLSLYLLRNTRLRWRPQRASCCAMVSFASCTATAAAGEHSPHSCALPATRCLSARRLDRAALLGWPARERGAGAAGPCDEPGLHSTGHITQESQGEEGRQRPGGCAACIHGFVGLVCLCVCGWVDGGCDACVSAPVCLAGCQSDQNDCVEWLLGGSGALRWHARGVADS